MKLIIRYYRVISFWNIRTRVKTKDHGKYNFCCFSAISLLSWLLTRIQRLYKKLIFSWKRCSSVQNSLPVPFRALTDHSPAWSSERRKRNASSLRISETWPAIDLVFLSLFAGAGFRSVTSSRRRNKSWCFYKKDNFYRSQRQRLLWQVFLLLLHYFHPLILFAILKLVLHGTNRRIVERCKFIECVNLFNFTAIYIWDTKGSAFLLSELLFSIFRIFISGALMCAFTLTLLEC